MDNLDKKITNLFISLVNSNKYFHKVDYVNRSLIYNVNGKEITIYMYYYNSKDYKFIPNSYYTIDDLFQRRWAIFSMSTPDTIGFKISIDNRFYDIPKFERLEHAKILNSIDKRIMEYESNILNSVYNTVINEEY